MSLTMAKGVAFLSGSGGSGRTTVASNLAFYASRKRRKALLVDFCFGWNGIDFGLPELPDYNRIINTREDIRNSVLHTEYGFDVLTCTPPEILDPKLEDMRKLAKHVNELGKQYDYLIIDPPSGGHPLALLAAGLCEQICLLTRPDASSVATSYSLLKSLNTEGLFSRTKLIFNLVESPDHALSLRNRFDIITRQFLGLSVEDGGFIFKRASQPSDDLYINEFNEESQASLSNINLGELFVLQDETRPVESLTNVPESVFERR